MASHTNNTSLCKGESEYSKTPMVSARGQHTSPQALSPAHSFLTKGPTRDRTGAKKGPISEQHVVEWYRVPKIAHATRTRTHQPANTRRTRLSVEERIYGRARRERPAEVRLGRHSVGLGAEEPDHLSAKRVEASYPPPILAPGEIHCDEDAKGHAPRQMRRFTPLRDAACRSRTKDFKPALNPRVELN